MGRDRLGVGGLRTLARTVKRGVAAGEPLPAPWPIFEEKRALIRRGGITEFAGPPGSMKTVALINVSMRTNVPTLYFSSDSDDHTMASRVLAYQTGKPSEETERWLKGNQEFASDVLKAADHIKWCFNPAPTFQDLYNELDAFAEIHGQYPHMVVIDILMDIDDGTGTVDQNYWATMAELKVMARETQSAIVLAHHTSESVKGEPCQPRSAIMGKANQLPILILTLAGDSFNNRLHFAVVKNRYGKGDATGRTYFSMFVDAAVCKITPLSEPDPPMVVQGPWSPTGAASEG